MANMNLVTGHWDADHVTSQEARILHSSIFGDGNYVLKDRGQQFAIRQNEGTWGTITVSSGEGIMQGAHFRIDSGEEVELAISPGSAGYYRNDLVCARYTKNAATAVEEVNLVIIKGEFSATNAVDPIYNTGDIIDEDAIIVDFPLWRIKLDGGDVSFEPLFTLATAALSSYPIGSIYMSVNKNSPEEIFGGKWSPLDAGYVLQTTTTSGTGGAKAAATQTASTILTAAQSGLPQHTHTIPEHIHDITDGTISCEPAGSHHHRPGESIADDSDADKYDFLLVSTGATTEEETYSGQLSGNSKKIFQMSIKTGSFKRANSLSYLKQFNTSPVNNHSHSVKWVSGKTVTSGTLTTNNNTAQNATEGHTHTTGMPQSIKVFMWQRTA